LIKPQETKTFEDFAYAVHDQSEYLVELIREIKASMEQHYLTKRVK
jgi:hypothetical protein